jgi:hypothetical protein
VSKLKNIFVIVVLTSVISVFFVLVVVIGIFFVLKLYLNIKTLNVNVYEDVNYSIVEDKTNVISKDFKVDAEN